MKILYVANQRRAAQEAAQALRDVAPDLSLSWAESVSPALRWIRDNPDVAALVLETGAQNQSCASFVEHLRGLGLTTPVIIIAPEGAGAPLAELRAGADDYIVNNQSLLAELPLVLTRALERTEAAAVATKAPMRLLYVGDAALARRCVEHLQKSIEITAVVPESSGAFPALPLSFDIVLVEYGHPGVDAFAILKDIAHRRLLVPVILVVEWDEKLAIPAFKLGAVDYVVKAADSFRALFFKLDRAPAISPPHDGHADLLEADADQKAAEVAARERLERELGDALATARDTERSLNTATEHFRESEARLQATIDQERTERETLEARLAEAEASRQEAERQRALEASASAAQRLERQGQDAARRAALEERLAELESALEHANRRRELEADLEERLTQEVAARTALEQDLASAEAARLDLELRSSVGADGCGGASRRAPRTARRLCSAGRGRARSARTKARRT